MLKQGDAVTMDQALCLQPAKNTVEIHLSDEFVCSINHVAGSSGKPPVPCSNIVARNCARRSVTGRWKSAPLADGCVGTPHQLDFDTVMQAFRVPRTVLDAWSSETSAVTVLMFKLHARVRRQTILRQICAWRSGRLDGYFRSESQSTGKPALRRRPTKAPKAASREAVQFELQCYTDHTSFDAPPRRYGSASSFASLVRGATCGGVTQGARSEAETLESSHFSLDIRDRRQKR